METSTAPDLAVVTAATDRLARARAELRPCTPVRDLIAVGDLATAYAVQREWVGRRERSGAVRTGRKIGLTSPAVQAQLGVDQPDFGVLLDEMEARGGVVPVHQLLQPKVEAEIAFVLGDDLTDGPLGIDRVRSAVEYAVAALEVVDSRIALWDITFVDTVADNASSGMYVLGDRRVRLEAFAPVEARMEMRLDGGVVSTGSGAACLGDPLEALAWLARTSRELGDPLRAGEVVLSGALGPMVPVGPGVEVSAVITGLGEVSAWFGGGR